MASLGLAAGARGQFLYTVTNLGTDDAYSTANGINDHGLVVGSTSVAGGYHAFVHDGITMTDLGTLGGADSDAAAINADGKITGYSYTASGSYRAFLYDGSSMTDLGSLGSGYSRAYAINDSGDVVGESTGPGFAYTHSFLYAGSGLIDLNSAPPGAADSRAYGINNLGQIVGETNFTPSLFTGSSVISLGSLGGGYGSAADINNLGQIVGFSRMSTLEYRAFLYDDNAMINLGVLPGYATSEARSINDLGQIVGYSYNDSLSQHAFLSDGTVMTDLNAITDFSGSNFVTLLEARSINNLGQIVGRGITSSGQQNAFLLTPIGLSTVPEPSTYAAICTLGLATLAGHRLRRRRLAAKAARSAVSS